MAVSIALGATAASGALSAVGAKKQGKAAQQAAEYNASVARQNAKISRDNAAFAARKAEREGRMMQGAARARIGASGVLAEGSPLAALEMGARNISQDVLMIKHQGELDAISFENEAQLQQFSGKAAKTASNYAAASSLIGTVGSMAGTYAQYGKA